MNTATISIRTNPIIKKKAEKIFAQFGMNMSSAFNNYIRTIAEKKCIQ